MLIVTLALWGVLFFTTVFLLAETEENNTTFRLRALAFLTALGSFLTGFVPWTVYFQTTSNTITSTTIASAGPSDTTWMVLFVVNLLLVFYAGADILVWALGRNLNESS